MNVQDVLTRVQRTFGDEASVQVTEADVIRWINDAQLQIVVRNDGLLEATATTDTFTGQAEYNPPTDILRLRSLAYKGFRVKSMSFAEFNEYIDGFDATPGVSPYGPGIPEVFMVWNNVITLFPAPNEDVTAGLKIYYTMTPVSVGNLADALTVPLEYHVSVVDYCMEQAYALDEDFQKAAYSKGRFDSTVQELSEENKWTAQEYYPRITTLPEDENYGNYGYWGGYF